VWKWPVVKYKYQNKAKNLYTIYFVFDLEGECKFIKTKHYSDETNLFFLAATLVEIFFTERWQIYGYLGYRSKADSL